MRSLIIICLFPLLALSQQTIEASGQTKVFTLKAGAKAGPVGIKQVHKNLQRIPACINIVDGKYIVIKSVKQYGCVTLYNSLGNKLKVSFVNKDGIVNLPRALPSGIYFVKLDMHGQAVQASFLRISR
jgi:hypothetical protein